MGSGVPLVLSSLYADERKVTVSHLKLTRTGDSEESLKSKETLSIAAGFRRFACKPIYSEIAKKTADKQKFARFFHPGMTLNAAFFAPAFFPPAPVLAFKQS